MTTNTLEAPQKLTFDPEKSLFDLPIVRRTAVLFLCSSIVIAITIALNTDQPFDFSGEGFNHSAYLYRVPLAILAVGITLVGIFGANHRSEQTRRQIIRNAEQIALTTAQISATEAQNKFSNYYKHIEEFVKYAGEDEFGVKITSIRELYSKLFPWSSSGDYTLDPNLVEEVRHFAFGVVQSIATMQVSTRDERLRITVKLVNYYYEFLGRFYMSAPVGKLSSLRYDGEEAAAPGGDFRTFFAHLVNICRRLDKVFSFDLSYHRMPVIAMLKEADPTSLYGSSYATHFDNSPSFAEVFGDLPVGELTTEENSKLREVLMAKTSQ